MLVHYKVGKERKGTIHDNQPGLHYKKTLVLPRLKNTLTLSKTLAPVKKSVNMVDWKYNSYFFR